MKMNNNITLLIAFLLSIVFITPGIQADSSALSISGIEIGMTPEQVTSKLEAKGFTPEPCQSYAVSLGHTRKQRSFQQEFNFKQGKRIDPKLYSDTAKICMKKEKQGDYITIQFVSLPKKNIVDNVEFFNDNINLSKETMQSKVKQKYGAPSCVKKSSSKAWFYGDGSGFDRYCRTDGTNLSFTPRSKKLFLHAPQLRIDAIEALNKKMKEAQTATESSF